MFTTPMCSDRSSKPAVGVDPHVEEDVVEVVDHRDHSDHWEEREALVVLFATTRSLFWESYSIHHPRPSVPHVQHVHQHSSHPTPHHYHHYHPDGSWARGELGKHVVAMEFVQLSTDTDDPSAMGDIISSPTPIRDRARRQRVLEQVHATLWAEHYPSLPSTYLTRHMGFHYQRPAPTLLGPDGGNSATTANSHLNLYTNPIMGTYCLLIQVQHYLDQRRHQQHQPQHQRPSPRLDAKQPRSTKHSPEVKRLLQELQERFYQYHEHHPQPQQNLSPLSAPTPSSIISLSLQLGIAGAIQGIFYLRHVLKAPRLFTSHVVRYSVRILRSLQPSTTTMPITTSCTEPSTTWPSTLPLGMSKGLVGILFTLLACSKQDWKQIQGALQGDSENCEGNDAPDTNSDQSPLMDVRTMVDQLWNDVKQSLHCITTNDNDSQQPQDQVASSPQEHKLLQHLQWSNGAAGLICLLIRAAKVFESNQYFQAAQALADYIWHHYQRHRQNRLAQGIDSSSVSLPSSSFGLANGMSGIAMSFICVARYCPAGPVRSQWEQKADVLLHHTIHDWHASTTTSTLATSSNAAVASAASSSTSPCYGIWDGLGGLLSVLFFRFHHQQPIEFPMFPTCHGSKRLRDPLILPRSEPMGSVMEPFSWATSTTTLQPLDSADRSNRQRRPQLVIDTSIVSPYPVVSRRSYGPAIAISGSGYGRSRRPQTTTTPRTTVSTTANTMTPIRLTRAAQLRMDLMNRSRSISSPSTSGTFTTSRIPAVPPIVSTPSSGNTSPLVVTRGHHQSQSNVPGRLFDNINHNATAHTRKVDPSKTMSLDQRRRTLQAEHKAKLVKAKESRRRREEQQAQLRAHRLEAERNIQFEKRRAKLQEVEADAAHSQQRRAQKEREMMALAIRRAIKVQSILAADQVDTEATQPRKLPPTRIRTRPERLERANGIRNEKRPDQDPTKKIETNRQVKTEPKNQLDKDDHKRTREARDKDTLLDNQCPGGPKSPESDQKMLQTTSPPTASQIDSNVSIATSMSDPRIVTTSLYTTVTSDQHRMVEQRQSMPVEATMSASLPESDNEMSAFDVTFQAPDRNVPLPESPDDRSPISGEVSKAVQSNDETSQSLTSIEMRTPNEALNDDHAFKSTDKQRKASNIKLTEDEDFESINAMFAEAESLLESQLASILGPVDGTIQEVAQHCVAATSRTMLSSYSKDDDVPISSEVPRNSHTNSWNDGNDFVSAAPIETSTEFDRSTGDTHTGTNITLLVNVQRVSEKATLATTRNGEGKPLHEPKEDQEVQESIALLPVTGLTEGTSDSKAWGHDETHAIVMNEGGADDGGGGAAMTGTGLRGATVDQPPSWAVTESLTTTAHPHDHSSTLAHPHAGSSTTGENEPCIPIKPPQNRPLAEVEIEQSTPFVQRIDRSSALGEVESSTPFDMGRDSPSTMVTTPAAPSQGRLEPSFDDMNHTEEDEEDFDDDFARMDSLFEEAENQLKAELASILGPSLDRNPRHASEEREMDDDVLPSIIAEGAGLFSDSFTDANSTTTASSKEFVSETDLTPTTMSSFSRGTLRRRGNRKVAPGH